MIKAITMSSFIIFFTVINVSLVQGLDKTYYGKYVIVSKNKRVGNGHLPHTILINNGEYKDSTGKKSIKLTFVIENTTNLFTATYDDNNPKRIPNIYDEYESGDYIIKFHINMAGDYKYDLYVEYKFYKGKKKVKEMNITYIQKDL